MRINVNNQQIEVGGQRPLIEELREIGIDVPSMCYARDYHHEPSCMLCMVKDVKTGEMIPSCSVMPYDGMQIETDSEEVHEMRRLSLELLLSDHRADCEAPCTLVCPRGLDVAQVILHYDRGEIDQARTLLRNHSCDDCKAPCEKACRRGTIDERVSIRQIIQTLKEGGEVSPAVSEVGISYSKKEKRFNSLLGRFTEAEKQRMKATYTQSSRCLHCACEGRSTCQLRQLATQAGIKASRYGIQSSLPVKESIPVSSHLVYEPAKCIRCGLCVYNTQDGFTFERRGFDMRVVIPEENKKNIREKIAELCPTGALFLKLLLPFLLLLTGCRSLPDGSEVKKELPEHPQLLWEYRHNVRSVAAPVEYDGMILFCDKHGQMKGLDRETGKEQFSLSLGADMEASFIIEDSTLYLGMIDGRIRSLSLTDGTEKWSYETEGQIAAMPVLSDINGERRLFVGSYDNYMYTLSPQTGKLIHRVPTGYYINGAAALWEKYVLFGGCDSWVRIVDGITGLPTDSLLLDAYIPASPVIADNQAYIADFQGDLYELTLSNGHISSHKKIIQAAEDDGGMLSVPIVTEDALYVLMTDRSIVCLDRKNGHQRWKTTLKGDTGECSPLLVDDRLIVCTKTGVVTIHDSLTGQQLWEYETGEQIIAQPVIGEMRFYVLTARGTLLCFGNQDN
ncbi:MAG: PQQ-binding-like beta-propeller repeat protein [Prevotella sp.]|nr:PQQ-binding-like beta-propeller repeat protein [Prevotella sp.]